MNKFKFYELQIFREKVEWKVCLRKVVASGESLCGQLCTINGHRLFKADFTIKSYMLPLSTAVLRSPVINGIYVNKLGDNVIISCCFISGICDNLIITPE